MRNRQAKRREAADRIGCLLQCLIPSKESILQMQDGSSMTYYKDSIYGKSIVS